MTRNSMPSGTNRARTDTIKNLWSPSNYPWASDYYPWKDEESAEESAIDNPGANMIRNYDNPGANMIRN